MQRILEIYDIETLINLFTYTGYRPSTNEYKQFVIHDLRNDIDELYHWLMDDPLYMVGFNNEKFDYPIIHHIINHYEEYRYLSNSEIAQNIYRKSQEVISMEFSAIADKNKFIPQLDLFLIWHYNNKAKHCSLKQIEIALRLDNVEDMPIHHEKWITSWDEIELVLSYNKNDVYATHEFFKVTQGETELPLFKGKNKLDLRKYIAKEFNLNCFNWNDVKIGDEISKKVYSRESGNIYITKPNDAYKSDIFPIHLSECICDNVKFETQQLNDFLDSLKKKVVNSTKGDFEASIEFMGVTFTFAQGGLHTKDLPRIFTREDDEELEDRDCTSMYPLALLFLGLFPRRLGPEWATGYQWIFDQRVYHKKRSKDKSLTLHERKISEAIQEAFKLALNGGGYGKTGEESSWQYDPKVTMTVTINNQLYLLMLCEQYLLNGADVISANTDGVVIKFKKSIQNTINNIDRNWEKTTGHILEYAKYDKFIQTSVNDYITLKPDGTCKFKGDFEIDRDLHKNQSMIIVAIALKEYFINNIPVRETILNHKNIFDFCLTLRLNKGWDANYHYIEEGKLKIKPLNKTTRYYISNESSCIIKTAEALEKDKIKGKLTRNTGVNVGYSMTLFNHYEKKEMKDYKINHNFYINECNKIIDQIEIPKIQLKLF